MLDAMLAAGFHWSQLLQPQYYIEHGGLWLLLFVVFAETGLFAGFFLPGDSLLFVAGIYSSNLANEILPTGNEYLDLLVLLLFISAAGIMGNATGYWFGKKVGPSMYGWKENILFKQRIWWPEHQRKRIMGKPDLPRKLHLPVWQQPGESSPPATDRPGKRIETYQRITVDCVIGNKTRLIYIGGFYHFNRYWCALAAMASISCCSIHLK